ncbi:MAG: biliverdin-producing heme oxygenase [Phycisphaerae bacterium]
MEVQTPTIMSRLREETALHHERAENKPLEQALVSGSLPRDMYVAMLQQRFLIHRTLEAQIRELRAADAAVERIVQDELFQEENIVADLTSFGADAEHVMPMRATKSLLDLILTCAKQTPLALLGIYYVFEGSKNGSRFIARKIGPALGLTREHGMRYLDPHGENQRPLWMAFKQRMDAVGFADDAQDAMVEAAKRTFDAIGALDDEIFSAYPR